MKYLKRFNESGSHDWRANAFPGASEEEIEKAIAKAKEEKPGDDKKSDVKSEPREPSFTDEQYEMLMMGYPMSQVLAHGEKDK